MKDLLTAFVCVLLIVLLPTTMHSQNSEDPYFRCETANDTIVCADTQQKRDDLFLAAKTKEEHRVNLEHALTTRVLTEKELAEVLEMGTYLVIRHGQSYQQSDVDQLFLTDLKLQLEIRQLKGNCAEAR